MRGLYRRSEDEGPADRRPTADQGRAHRGPESETPLDPGGLIQVGYYHIVAAHADEAVAIAKRNPEFEFSDTAQVEVRMIKGSEAGTGFVYSR